MRDYLVVYNNRNYLYFTQCEGKTKADVAKKMHACVDNVYRMDLSYRVINWEKNDTTHIRPVINLDDPDNKLRYTIGDEIFDYITFREFRGDVNDYRDR